jgi:hypothetical protein
VRTDGKLEPFGQGILHLIVQHDPLSDAYVSARRLYRSVVGRLFR